MRKFFAALAVVGILAAPATARTTPQPAPSEKAKTVTKVVCERANVEETTGSRLGSAPKVCQKVQVAPEGAGKKGNESDAPSHSGGAH